MGPILQLAKPRHRGAEEPKATQPGSPPQVCPTPDLPEPLPSASSSLQHLRPASHSSAHHMGLHARQGSPLMAGIRSLYLPRHPDGRELPKTMRHSSRGVGARNPSFTSYNFNCIREEKPVFKQQKSLFE